MELKSTPFLEIDKADHDVTRRTSEQGIVYIKSNIPLEDHPFRMTERLIKWADEIPDKVFLGQRDEKGDWRTITYAETLENVLSLAQYLLDKGVNNENPIAILSGNSIEHGLLALAALHIGVPYSPISPAYSTKSTDYSKLKHCINLLTPGLIFVQNGKGFEKALAAIGDTCPILSVDEKLPGQDDFNEVSKVEYSEAVSEAYGNISEETIAKVLFTSGSTGVPKGVINTHGNITTNWQQITQTFPFMKYENVGINLIDWLPWNHTFGGNHNFGITLYNGGSLYIDEGNPTPKGITKTVRNLRDIAPTVYFNVPKGFEELLKYLNEDDELSTFFFSKLNLFFYAGASMAKHIWDGLEELAYRKTGKRLLISTGLGMTEGSPSCMFNTRTGGDSKQLGVPVPGLEVKLVPDGDKIEARFKGGNLTPGYWRDPKATAKAFDEEGFYKTGDALKLIDEDDPNKGMLFDGRIAEDFKLNTGTWVNVGILRGKLLEAGNGLIQDSVITGHDREFIGAIIIPELKQCRRIANLPETVSDYEVVNHPTVRAELQDVINDLGAKSTGSSTYVSRVIIADFELSLDKGEITDKGSINQRRILKNRSETVNLLYQDNVPENVIEFQNLKR